MGICDSKQPVESVSTTPARSQPPTNTYANQTNNVPRRMPEKPEKPYKQPGAPLVFLSYSWRYRKLDVQRLAKDFLEQQPDFDIWLDVDNMPGDFIYKAMSDAIDRAALVVVFFSKPYPTPDSNSMREFEYALSEGKRMLLIQLDPTYKPDGAFKLAVGSRLYFKFREGEDYFYEDAENVAKQIREMLAAPKAVSKSIGEAKQFRFSSYNVPLSISGYQAVPEQEALLSQRLVDICNHPDKGFLVLTGPPGVGKTTILAKVIGDLSSASVVDHLAEPAIIIWLNCSQWSSQFNRFPQNQVADFEDTLLGLARLADNDFDGFEMASISKYFRKNGERHVLYVLDDLDNNELYEFFVRQHSREKREYSCCIVTRDMNVLENRSHFRAEFVQALAENSISQRFTASLENDKLIESSLKQLNQDEQQSFYNVLLFDAEEPITPNDFKILIPKKVNLAKFLEAVKKLSLLRESPPDSFLIIHLAYDGLLNYVCRMLQISENLSRLEKLRLVRRALLLEHSSAHMVLFDVLKQGKRKLLHRILSGLTPDDGNPDLLGEVALAEDAETKQSFLASLYKFKDWPEKRQIDTKWEGIGRWESNISYQIIIDDILRVIKRANRQDLLEKIAREAKDFMTLLYGDEETVWYWCARGAMLCLMRPWKWLGVNYVWLQRASTKSKTSTMLKDIQEDRLDDVKGNDWSLEAAVRCHKIEAVKAIWKKMPKKSKKTKSDEDSDGEEEHGESNDESADDTKSNDSRKSNDEEKGLTPFILAAQHGLFDVVKYIAKSDPQQISACDFLQRTGLWHAASSGHFEVVKYLAEMDSKLALKASFHEQSPKLAAATNGHLKVVKFLEDIEAKFPEDQCQQFDSEHQSPLWLAAQQGHFDLVKYFAAKDQELITRSCRSIKSPLRAAMEYGHWEIVQFLADKNEAMISRGCNDGSFPLWKASQVGYFHLARYFARKDPETVGAIKSNFHQFTSLYVAAENGHDRIVKLLAEMSSKTVTVCDQRHNSPLLAASIRGQVEVIRFLVKCNASLITLRNRDGQTPLHAACEFGSLEAAKILIDGCPRDQYNDYLAETDGRGRTAFFLAAMSGSMELVRYLAELLPKQVLKKAGPWGKTPAMIAEGFHHPEVANFINEVLKS